MSEPTTAPTMPLLGVDCVLYRQGTAAPTTWSTAGPTAGVYSGPAPSGLIRVDSIRGDVSLKMDPAKLDAHTRAGGRIKGYAYGLMDASITFEMLWDPADTHFAAFLAAMLGRSEIAIACLDGSAGAHGSEGLWARMLCLVKERKEPTEALSIAEIELVPASTRGTNFPASWVRVDT